jgi:hypothetical protein
VRADSTRLRLLQKAREVYSKHRGHSTRGTLFRSQNAKPSIVVSRDQVQGGSAVLYASAASNRSQGRRLRLNWLESWRFESVNVAPGPLRSAIMFKKMGADQHALRLEFLFFFWEVFEHGFGVLWPRLRHGDRIARFGAGRIMQERLESVNHGESNCD